MGNEKICICQNCGEDIYIKEDDVIGICDKCGECASSFYSNN